MASVGRFALIEKRVSLNVYAIFVSWQGDAADGARTVAAVCL